MTQLKRKGLDRYAYLFIATMVSRLTEKYSFNREINDERIKREHLLLPATEKGEIDFEFMTKFMQEVESDILGTTLKYLRERQSVNKCKMGGVNWRTYEFTELFRICKGFYNKKPPCPENGQTPFIGATDSNNGITGFTTHALIRQHSKTGMPPNESFERKLFPGGAICVTNNGSVGYAYYQASEFTCTHDVNPLYLKDRMMTRHIAMFLCRSIEQQRVCFAYARKWRPKRMVRSKLSLPSCEDGSPDWDYMENYMREKEQEHIIKYLEMITSPSRSYV